MKRTTKFTEQQISIAKQKSIAGYLASRNIEPIGQSGNELVYLSPLRTENTPSFHVNLKKNSFNDFGDDEMRGDSIRLVQKLNECSFVEAVTILLESELNTPISFSFSGPFHSEDKERQHRRITINYVQKLQNKALIRYVTNRGGLLNHAFAYLHEIHFEVGARQYFAAGFKNDSGGYELRNGLGFKGKTANGITTFDMSTDSVSIFEGFFDFLSALRHFQREKPANTAIILNTVANLNVALPIICDRKTINCFLDNDVAGEKAIQKLENKGLNIKNWSKILYPTHKDFNDFIVNTRNATI